jgi:prepilin-type processing-associated H-X9-DG protein
MLLPALGKARDKARAIACVNNMRTTGRMFIFYAQDSNGYMPIAYDPDKTRSWLHPLNTMLKRTRFFQISKAPEILLCPARLPETPVDENGERNTTYTYNRRLGDLVYFKAGQKGYHPRKLSRARHPSLFVTLLEGDSDGERITIVTADSDILKLLHLHNNKNNHLYADGHVAAAAMLKTLGDWRAWCQPYSYFPYRTWNENSQEW